MATAAKNDDPRDNQRGRSHVTDTPQLKAFYEELSAVNSDAFWNRANAIEPWEPITRYKPTVWRYKTMRDLCLRAIDLVDPEKAGRRVIALMNASEAGRENTAVCGWLFSGLQAMKPGEITPAHKHTASAHRFIMEGGGAYTVVDGHRITLGKHDYVLTPNGCWHDHGVAEDGETSIWQDGLDIPLMNVMEANFYAVYDAEAQVAQHPTDDLPLSYGSGLLPEKAPQWDKPFSPVMVYRWLDVQAAIAKLAQVSEPCPHDGYMMRYSNPLTGGWALKTMGANMQMLPKGFTGKAHRHTGNVVYNVAGGEGYSIIGDTRIDWGEHDIFCVPSWMWHEHVNTGESDAYLFSFNDFPVMEAMGVMLAETRDNEGGYQKIVR